MFELLQGLNREWPPEICEFIRDNCWVINNTARQVFMPVDEAQEMNIKDIKVTYRSEGPNIDWQYIKKLHPAVHVIREVNNHVESEFKTKIRGRNHTVPKKELDLQELQTWYRASNVHAFVAGRKITRGKYGKSADILKDIPTQGAIALQTGETLARWVDTRTVDRATTQNWDLLCESDDDD